MAREDGPKVCRGKIARALGLTIPPKPPLLVQCTSHPAAIRATANQAHDAASHRCDRIWSSTWS